MPPRKVIIFGKDTCPYTASARKDYGEKGYAVDYRNVYRRPQIMDEMLKFTKGERDVPVIVEDGRVTVGWGGT